MRAHTFIPFLMLLTACPVAGPVSGEDLAPPAAEDLARSDLNTEGDTFGCDYRPLGARTDYCQDIGTREPTIRASYKQSCTASGATLLAGPCPHLQLGACREVKMLGSVPITLTNWFSSYPGVSTTEEMKAVCVQGGSAYVAP